MPLKTTYMLKQLETESAFGLLADIERLKHKGLDVINLGIGQPDFSTPETIQKAAIQAIKDGHHGYTPANGIEPLREAVIDNLYARHGKSGFLNNLTPDRIMIVPGGKVTMAQTITIFGGKGNEIIYPDPGFPIYKSLINHSGACAIPLKLKAIHGFSPHIDELRPLINERTSLIILNSPANPTGGVMPAEQVNEIAALLREHPNIALMSDEIYDGLTFKENEGKSFCLCDGLDNQLIMLDGWSKRYAMTGWRIGFAVWPQSLIAHVHKLAINSYSCVNAPTQYAALSALTGSQESIATMRQAFAKRAEYFVNALNQLAGVSCQMPKGAFYAFANIEGTGYSAPELQQLLLEKAGVGALAGEGFGEAGKGHMRFSFAASHDQLEQAITRMQAFFNS